MARAHQVLRDVDHRSPPVDRVDVSHDEFGDLVGETHDRETLRIRREGHQRHARSVSP